MKLQHYLEGWGHLSKTLRNALIPDASVEHAKKTLGRDDRMRVYMPADSQWGAMYPCKQAHIDWAGISSINSSAGKALPCPFQKPTLVLRCCALLSLSVLSCRLVARDFWIVYMLFLGSQSHVALLSIPTSHHDIFSDFHVLHCVETLLHCPHCVLPFQQTHTHAAFAFSGHTSPSLLCQSLVQNR